MLLTSATDCYAISDEVVDIGYRLLYYFCCCIISDKVVDIDCCIISDKVVDIGYRLLYRSVEVLPPLSVYLAVYLYTCMSHCPDLSHGEFQWFPLLLADSSVPQAVRHPVRQPSGNLYSN